MLYQAIRAGSEQYRSDPNLNCSNKAYRKLLCCDMDHSKWRDPPTLDKDEVGKVRDFVARTWKDSQHASEVRTSPPCSQEGIAEAE